MPPPGELNETCAVFDSGLFPPLYGNMTSSTKPEVHNMSHCRQRKTEPRSRVTCTKKFGEIWTWVFLRYTSGHTNKHAETLLTILHNTSQFAPLPAVIIVRLCYNVKSHHLLSPLHTSNNVEVTFDFVEATLDFVAKNTATMSNLS